jgi:hypothetical protein
MPALRRPDMTDVGMPLVVMAITDKVLIKDVEGNGVIMMAVRWDACVATVEPRILITQYGAGKR